MSYERFKEVHIATSKWEGGYVDHPQDPGGKTKYGITQKVWRAWCKEQGIKAIPVKDIKYEDALKIYFEWYWVAARCDTLAPGVDRMVYDAAVNSGPVRAREWLMKSIGGSTTQTVERYYNTRMDFLHGLSTWKTFGKGWTNRNKDIYRLAMEEAKKFDRAPKPTPRPTNVPKEVTEKAKDIAKPMPTSTTTWSGLLTLLSGLIAALAGLDKEVQLVLIGLCVCGVLYMMYQRKRLAGHARDILGLLK